MGDFTTIGSFVFIGGGAQIGSHVTIFPNANILPGIKIGCGARIGSGSVVIRDVSEGETVMGNHIPFVHAKSFKPWLINNKQELSNNKTAEEWLEISKVSIDNLSYTSRAEIFDSLPWYRSLITRYFDNNDHISWYLYPNTHFASVRNDYFFIQQYDPASKDTINFNLIVFTSKKKNSSTDFTALLRALIIEERKIIEEDSIVLGQLQASLGSWSPDPVHGAYEYHISQQNKWYLDNVINN